MTDLLLMLIGGLLFMLGYAIDSGCTKIANAITRTHNARELGSYHKKP